MLIWGRSSVGRALEWHSRGALNIVGLTGFPCQNRVSSALIISS